MSVESRKKNVRKLDKLAMDIAEERVALFDLDIAFKALYDDLVSFLELYN